MHIELLPIDDVLTVCQCEGGTIAPQAPFPVARPWRWTWSDDRTHVLALDGPKAASTFSHAEGRFEPAMQQARLPDELEVRCAAMRGPAPFLAGRGLWSPNEASEWRPAELPKLARGRHKSIDGLIVAGDRLIAVDNIVMPKWNLEFDISDPFAPKYLRAVRIPAHSSYEHITAAAGGDGYFAAVSHTMNHGNSASHCALYDLSSLEHVRSWTFATEFRPGHWSSTELSGPAIVGRWLCVVEHPSGMGGQPALSVLRIPAGSPWQLTEMYGKGAEFQTRPLPELASVSGLHRSADSSGVYIVGKAPDGPQTTVWRPLPRAV